MREILLATTVLGLRMQRRMRVAGRMCLSINLKVTYRAYVAVLVV